MPVIAKYYKQLIAEAHFYSRMRHPASFVGMFDCGKNYVFNLVVTTPLSSSEPLLVPISLTETQAEEKNICTALSLGLTQATKKPIHVSTFEDAFFHVQEICSTTPLTLVLHIGTAEQISVAFLDQIHKWRMILGKRLSWLVFANYDILHSEVSRNVIFEKIIKTNVIPIRLLDSPNTLRVLKNYQEYLGGKKVDEKELIQLSGGNSGLLKSLYQLAKQGRLDHWQQDEQTCIRLHKIMESLSQQELRFLRKLNAPNKTEQLKKTNHWDNLTKFNFIDQKGRWFSPLMDAYFRSQYDDTEIKLSTTQLAIVEELKKHAPSVVSRDGIAQIMWGAKWRDKYSDWAIDQMIYAIRAVLTKYKSPWQLKTRRGKGYYVLKKKYGTPTF